MSNRWLIGAALILFAGGIFWFVYGERPTGPERAADGAEAYFVSENLSDEEALTQRTQSRWEGIISGDMERAYLHATPAYRAVYDFQHYQNQYARQIERQRVEVRSVKVDPEDQTKARVTVMVHFTTSGFEPNSVLELSSPVRESWVKEDGQWWYVESR